MTASPRWPLLFSSLPLLPDIVDVGIFSEGQKRDTDSDGAMQISRKCEGKETEKEEEDRMIPICHFASKSRSQGPVMFEPGLCLTSHIVKS